MRTLRSPAVILALVLSLAPVVVAAPVPKESKEPRPVKVKIHEQGDLFCPTSVLVYGNVVIQANRCYVLAVTRESHGTFLAFMAPGMRIPPGQLVRLNTPAGAKLKGNIFYLVPIRPSVVIVPIDTVALISTRWEDFGSRMSLTVIGTPAANLTVIFDVRL